MRRPSGEYATLMTQLRMPAEAGELDAAGRVPDPHRLVLRPADDAAAVGGNATLVTRSACPRRQASSTPLAASQTRTVWSSDPLTMRRPSGEYATLVTLPVMPAEAGQLGAAVGVPDPHRPVVTTR